MRTTVSLNKGEKTRQRIVAEAAPLFNQKGYAGCSLHDVMTAAEVEKGGLYRHFASKEDLALAAFDYAWHEVSQGRTRGLEEIDDPLLRVEAFISNFVDRRPVMRGGCPLLNTAIDTDDGNVALRERAREALRDWHSRLTSLLALAVRQGALKRQAHPQKLASIIISILEGALMMSRLEGDRSSLETARDHLIAHLKELRAKRSKRH